jgi:hypothetical protein
MSAQFVACARLRGSAAAQPRNPRHLIRAPGVARSPFSHTDAGVPGVRQRGVICLGASGIVETYLSGIQYTASGLLFQVPRCCILGRFSIPRPTFYAME